MKVKEHFENLSKEELLESVLSIAKYAELDIEADVKAGCTGHEGQCGVCDHNVWIPCGKKI